MAKPPAKNEKTGPTIGSIASKAMRTPEKMSDAEIRALGASAMTQRPDQVVKLPPAKPPAAKKPAPKKS